MFLWSIQIMIEPLTYIGMFYLVYVFINKHDVGLTTKVITGIIYAPLIIITPTIYSLAGFDLSLCIPIESFYSYYTYVLELSAIIGIAFYALFRYSKEQSTNIKKEILLLSLGVIAFLLVFASGNIFGSLTDDWVTSQFGLFGTPIFATFIGYLLAGSPGAILATVGIFFPSFVFVLASSPLIPRLRRSPWTAAFLDGVNVASLGLMAAVTWQLGHAALVDWLTLALALLSTALVFRLKINSVWLVVAGGVVGLLYKLFS